MALDRSKGDPGVSCDLPVRETFDHGHLQHPASVARELGHRLPGLKRLVIEVHLTQALVLGARGELLFERLGVHPTARTAPAVNHSAARNGGDEGGLRGHRRVVASGAAPNIHEDVLHHVLHLVRVL